MALWRILVLIFMVLAGAQAFAQGPPGSVDCGDDRYCPGGSTCIEGGRYCLPNGWVHCGGTRACPTGTMCTSTGCIPRGSVDCGGGHYCSAGNVCTSTGCIPRGTVDCGSNRYCPAGNMCTGTGCIPSGSVDCGGGRYCPAGTTCSGDQCITGRPPAYECSVCEDGLSRNVAAHIGNPRMLATYVDQAIAYYENCKQRAVGSCMAGDLLVRTLRNGCDNYRSESEDAYHQCIKMIIENR